MGMTEYYVSADITGALATKANRKLTYNFQTGATYTLQLTDKNEVSVELLNAAPIAVTIPISVFSAGDVIIGAQTGAGQVTFAIAGGVGSLKTPTALVPKTRGLDCEWCLKCIIGGAAPTFRLSGDLAGF